MTKRKHNARKKLHSTWKANYNIFCRIWAFFIRFSFSYRSLCLKWFQSLYSFLVFNSFFLCIHFWLVCFLVSTRFHSYGCVLNDQWGCSCNAVEQFHYWLCNVTQNHKAKSASQQTLSHKNIECTRIKWRKNGYLQIFVYFVLFFLCILASRCTIFPF